MISRLLVVVVAVGLLVEAVPSAAHHSGSLYDRDHPITLTGTVTGWEMVMPHARVLFDVKEADGSVSKWMAGSAPPQKLYRAGWNRTSLKPGDIITVTGYPLKNGKKIMSIVKLVAPSGKLLTSGAE